VRGKRKKMEDSREVALSGSRIFLRREEGRETTRNEPVIILATVAFGRERSSSDGGRLE
jgi:hypothetical protein